ncbi:hypothetical protein M9H77_09689 [Catharanthus roseus]|uniref:Uncharacterized protein n=1 Tax=Catharanthus roseus TaxID=4058 RepID=A0ACC0C1B0_CATRO|nr:hypothetical protein M9H77_09689 [Catharanthus roseus]
MRKSDEYLVLRFKVILGPLWQTFVSSVRVYERAFIEGVEDCYDGRYDSDGLEKSLESFIIQLFETLLTVMGSKKFVQVYSESYSSVPSLASCIASNVKELLLYYASFYRDYETAGKKFVIFEFLHMQSSSNFCKQPKSVRMTSSLKEVHIWSLDANQYIAVEEGNTYSCRISAYEKRAMEIFTWSNEPRYCLHSNYNYQSLLVFASTNAKSPEMYTSRIFFDGKFINLMYGFPLYIALV